MKEVIDILSSLLTDAVMRCNGSVIVRIQTAFDEVEAAEAEIKGLKKELAELKERAAQDAINSLHGNTGGEYK
jgi:hypothetical protein